MTSAYFDQAGKLLSNGKLQVFKKRFFGYKLITEVSLDEFGRPERELNLPVSGFKSVTLNSNNEKVYEKIMK